MPCTHFKGVIALNTNVERKLRALGRKRILNEKRYAKKLLALTPFTELVHR